MSGSIFYLKLSMMIQRKHDILRGFDYDNSIVVSLILYHKVSLDINRFLLNCTVKKAPQGKVEVERRHAMRGEGKRTCDHSDRNI
ncbi:MAG: hypothetical protein ACYCY2_03555 [Acidithiobacillus ferriphilus]